LLLSLALKQANPIGFFGATRAGRQARSGDRPVRDGSSFRSVIKDCFLGQAPRQTGTTEFRRQSGAPGVGRTTPRRARIVSNAAGERTA
jgi:hypothetical protein